VQAPTPPATNLAPENPAPPAKPPETAANQDANLNSDKITPVEPAPAPAVVVVPPVPPASGPVVEPSPVAHTNAAPPAPVVAPATNEPPVAPIASDGDTENHAPPVALPVETNAAPVAPSEQAFPRALPVEVSTNAAPPADVSAATGEPIAPAPQPPVAAPAKDDEYTGGGDSAPPVAQPVNPQDATPTNHAPAIQ
jgi:hypothetical protein